MMNLYILRHGIAEERGTPGFENDADRPLTKNGKARVRRIARAMEELDLSFDLILSSPYLRARQTAELVAESLKASDKLQFSDFLTPEGDPKKLMAFLNRCKPAPENVLLAGHEPWLSRFISTLVFGDGSGSILLKKGGLSKLSAEKLVHGQCATLEWLLTPRQMLLITK